MKTGPIVPARIEVNAAGVPSSPLYGDVYHPAVGAASQARHVFLAGNGLPQRWRGRARFVVLETGFGLGNNFLATWDAWRHDNAACQRLDFISIEAHPPSREFLHSVERDSSLQPLGRLLADAWPALTWNLHTLAFDGGRVRLLLALGDVAAWLREIVARVDAFYLDGFAPSLNPAMWEARLFKAMARLSASGATAATWTAARAVRDGLRAAGFSVESAPGIGGKRDITLARYAPAFTPRPAPRLAATDGGNRHAAIVGGGLAGCASAWALAAQGWSSTVLDRCRMPAAQASGNPAGLFHGAFHAQDGTHARFNRAAALQARVCIGGALGAGDVRGDMRGALRLETSGDPAEAMQRRIDALGLPTDYVQAFTPRQAQNLSGLQAAHPAWFYPGGGWTEPGAFAMHLLAQAGDAARFVGGVDVHALRRRDGRWELLDAEGRVVEQADAVVLANGSDAVRLAGQGGMAAANAWPIGRIRGQLAQLPLARLGVSPRVPLAGAGYVLPALDGLVTFGATSQADDEDVHVRVDDHTENIAKLAALLGRHVDVRAQDVIGRVGWRATTPDRLPLIGAVPDVDAATSAARLDQPRFAPRMAGLFVFSALASRGITWSVLGAQVLASVVSTGPSPVESSLLDAVDPARFMSRASRRLHHGA